MTNSKQRNPLMEEALQDARDDIDFALRAFEKAAIEASMVLMSFQTAIVDGKVQLQLFGENSAGEEDLLTYFDIRSKMVTSLVDKHISKDGVISDKGLWAIHVVRSTVDDVLMAVDARIKKHEIALQSQEETK